MPTRWQLPPEPGPDVYAVRTDLGTTFIRQNDRWVSIPATDGAAGGWTVKWNDIIQYGLIDVSDEFTEPENF